MFMAFFFEGNVTGNVYLQMLQNWFMDKIIVNELEDFINQWMALHLTVQAVSMTICQENG